MRTLAARRNYQTALGTFLKFVRERTLHLVEDVKIDGSLVRIRMRVLQGVQHHHGSQLLVMDHWPVNPHLAGDVHASVRASGVEQEKYCPAACDTLR